MYGDGDGDSDSDSDSNGDASGCNNNCSDEAIMIILLLMMMAMGARYKCSRKYSVRTDVPLRFPLWSLIDPPQAAVDLV